MSPTVRLGDLFELEAARSRGRAIGGDVPPYVSRTRPIAVTDEAQEDVSVTQRRQTWSRCEYCGDPMVASRSDAKYHRACRQAAYRKRKREAASK